MICVLRFDKLVILKAMKKRLLAMTITIMTTTATIAMLIQQYPQSAEAFPCIGDVMKKEYCIGYHDGAIQAHKDFNSSNDISLDQHGCVINSEYCRGYGRGYSDEADFLG
jgi:hypothetical protein